MSRIPHTDEAAALLRHARSATPFVSKDGQPCASVPGSIDSRHVHALRSAAFRDWLTNEFYSEFEVPPSLGAFRAVLRTLEARARYGDFPPQTLDHRLGCEGDPLTPSKIVLDLANAAGEVVEINSHAWRIRDNMHHSFRQSNTTLALPRPIPPLDDDPTGNTEALQQFAQLFFLDATDRAPVFAWLIAALRPTGPYPILVLHGPAASGKTVLARALRALIDPSPANIRRVPDREDELLALASENWILAFDDAYQLSPKISGALCAIASGDALQILQPDLRDALEVPIARPIILVAPHDETKSAWTPSRSLSNRTLLIERTPLKRLQPEAELWSEFENLHPAMLAALVHAASTALHRVRDIDLPNVTRFADATVWAAAAAPALGLTEQTLVDALSDRAAVWVGSNPLRDALSTLLAPTGVWSGDPAALLNQLRVIAPRAALPATPKDLSQALPNLAGFKIDRTRTGPGAPSLTITRIAEEPQDATAGHMTRI